MDNFLNDDCKCCENPDPSGRNASLHVTENWPVKTKVCVDGQDCKYCEEMVPVGYVTSDKDGEPVYVITLHGLGNIGFGMQPNQSVAFLRGRNRDRDVDNEQPELEDAEQSFIVRTKDYDGSSDDHDDAFAHPERVSAFAHPGGMSAFAQPERVSAFAQPRGMSAFAHPGSMSAFAQPERVSAFAPPEHAHPEHAQPEHAQPSHWLRGMLASRQPGGITAPVSAFTQPGGMPERVPTSHQHVSASRRPDVMWGRAGVDRQPRQDDRVEVILGWHNCLDGRTDDRAIGVLLNIDEFLRDPSRYDASQFNRLIDDCALILERVRM